MTSKKGFTCKVCGEPFRDGWKHALTWSHPGSQGMSTGYTSKAHGEAIAEFMKDMFDKSKMCPLCGGEVDRWCSGSPDGDASWEIVCSSCGFLFDED